MPLMYFKALIVAAECNIYLPFCSTHKLKTMIYSLLSTKFVFLYNGGIKPILLYIMHIDHSLMSQIKCSIIITN